MFALSANYFRVAGQPPPTRLLVRDIWVRCCLSGRLLRTNHSVHEGQGRVANFAGYLPASFGWEDQRSGLESCIQDSRSGYWLSKEEPAASSLLPVITSFPVNPAARNQGYFICSEPSGSIEPAPRGPIVTVASGQRAGGIEVSFPVCIPSTKAVQERVWSCAGDCHWAVRKFGFSRLTLPNWHKCKGNENSQVELLPIHPCTPIHATNAALRYYPAQTYRVRKRFLPCRRLYGHFNSKLPYCRSHGSNRSLPTS